MKNSYLLGYDLGSSSIKVSLIDVDSGVAMGSAQSPDSELPISASAPGMAEQDPEVWWQHVQIATRSLLDRSKLSGDVIQAIGISYQMHGLVCLDKDNNVLRPAIIWCDSRAVCIGNKAFSELGEQHCLEKLYNSPGNFTASKLCWVKENEPKIFEKIKHFVLPGDYLAYKLSGILSTSKSGLSEGILWDFTGDCPAEFLLDYYDIDPSLIPHYHDSFEVSGTLNAEAAEALGLKSGIPIAYRAGDQVNNAFALGALSPGEIAANAGTSGVVYGVGEKLKYDALSRVNTFLHVNNCSEQARLGVLLCLNGTGILNSWARHNLFSLNSECPDYDAMNALAAKSPIGSKGISCFPYGNGAERSLGNRELGASFNGLHLTIHEQSDLLRSIQEGIVFALYYGIKIMSEMGIHPKAVRAANANMFLSPVFQEAFANVSGSEIALYDTDGAQGAARGAGVGAGIYKSPEEALNGLKPSTTITASLEKQKLYQEAYNSWEENLFKHLELN